MATDQSPRPRRRRKEARPAEILQAALQEFARNGLAATRLEDIARRAGIAKGTIYRYFDSKEELFIAVIRSRIVLSLDDFNQMINQFPGPTDALLRLVLTGIYREFVGTDIAALMRILISEGQRFPGLVDLYYDEVISIGVSMLSHIIQRGLERGEFRDSAAAREPRLIMAPAIMAALWRLTFNSQDPLSVDDFLNAHIDLVLHGLNSR
tara:strand:+ start:171 stop:797 length:627 start_codon:yes stop_codon:yes gene_type:complete